MKRIIVIVLTLFTVFFAVAQSETDSVKHWKRGGVLTANISQVSLSNWAAGGNSSASGVFLVNVFANYQKEKLSWDNAADFHYGFLNEKNKEAIKTNDKIDVSSKFGFKASDKWNYAAMANFKSQFAPGYKQPDKDLLSNFLDPA